MQIQRKPDTDAKSKTKPKTKPATAGPSDDDRGFALPGNKPIEGRLQNRAGGNDQRAYIQIAGGATQGVLVGMRGYMKDRAGGVLATFVIDKVEPYRSFAWVEVAASDLRPNAVVIINAAPPAAPRAAAPSTVKPRVIAYKVTGGSVEVTISRGRDHGVVERMRGELVAPDGERRSFTVSTVTARTAIGFVENTTIDEVRRFPEAELVNVKTAGAAAPVQRRATNDATATATDTDDVQATARAGVAGAASSLPFLDVIQRSFGKHDVSGVRAQIGGPATAASNALGARAYATGNTVAFASAPDLHTAAHEAAHTVQQARGAVGFQGLGAADDEHERHADAVADAVVAGRSAEALLDGVGGAGGAAAVQRKEDADIARAYEQSPFAKPMRPVLDWRKQLQPRVMPTPPVALDCELGWAPERSGVHEHPAKHTKPSPVHTEDEKAWPAIRQVSSAVKSTHGHLVSEVATYKNAEKDPSLKALLYTQPDRAGSLGAITDRQCLPERDGVRVAELFDEENQLAIAPQTHEAIRRPDRPRAETGRAAAGTVEKSAALRAAVHAMKGAVQGLIAARYEVDDALSQIAVEHARNHADAIREEISRLRTDATELKAALDAACAVLAGLAHAAAGETGDAISKVGELVGTVLLRINDDSIAALEAKVAVQERVVKTARAASLAAMLNARKARVQQCTETLDSARSAIGAATAARGAAYKQLGTAAASELDVPDTEKRRVMAAISAVPMVEFVAARARSIANRATLPAYDETLGHGLWLASSANDARVPVFVRALCEIHGARELYNSVANRWDRRLVQVRSLANAVGSHAAE